ncbi:MAG: hypothetical protein U9R48_07205 [Chloroflexota bacterium]|nr:hypothetical protein [Chloroflexota bacterium]
MIWLAAVRDVAILLLALESLVLGILLAVMMIQLRRLVQLLRDEIAPILDSAGETARTVHGTADVVSRTVVEPLVKASSYAAGARQALRSLLAVGRVVKNRASPTVGEEGAVERDA